MEVDLSQIGEYERCLSPAFVGWGGLPLPGHLGDRGRQDGMGIAARVEASYHSYIETPNTKLIWYDKGHRLGEIYVPDALAWVKQHLK